MEKEAIYDTIKKTVDACLPGSRVLLFGSQARGTSDKHSDYDLLVITPGPISSKEKMTWHTELDKALLKAIHAPFDVLLYSEEEVSKAMFLPGHIVRFAMKEGISL